MSFFSYLVAWIIISSRLIRKRFQKGYAEEVLSGFGDFKPEETSSTVGC